MAGASSTMRKADGKVLSLGRLLRNSEVQASKSEALDPGRALGLSHSLI